MHEKNFRTQKAYNPDVYISLLLPKQKKNLYKNIMLKAVPFCLLIKYSHECC